MVSKWCEMDFATIRSRVRLGVGGGAADARDPKYAESICMGFATQALQGKLGFVELVPMFCVRISSLFCSFLAFLGSLYFPLTRQTTYFFAGVPIPAKCFGGFKGKLQGDPIILAVP